MIPKFSPRVLASAIILSLGAASPAWSYNTDAAGPPHRMERRMEHHLRDLARLHAELKLDAQQETLWQEAEQASRNSMREVRAQMRQQREKALTAMRQPGADLRAIVRSLDEARDAGRQQRLADRERWLKVYDSLNPEQKEKARIFVLHKLERGPFGGRRDAPPPRQN